jgi:long-chain acyl-CoA synthetase
MAATAQNLATFFLDRARAHRHSKALLFKQEGHWTSIDWQEWASMSMRLARGMQALGLKPGGHVVLMAGTCHQWLLLSMAVALAGGVLVPVHQTLPEGEFADLLADVRPQLLLLADPALLRRLKRATGAWRGRLVLLETECVPAEPDPSGRPFLRLEDVVTNRKDALPLAQLASLGDGTKGEQDLLETTARGLPESPAMIIYTAGTLGQQKGVVLSHANLLYQARTLPALLSVGPEDTQLLFLPLSHVLGVISFLTSIHAGAVLALGGGLRSLLEDLRDVKPTFMVGVPRVFEKVVDKLNATAADFSTVWWETYRRGLAAGKALQESKTQGWATTMASRAQLEVARRTVFQRCRELLGGRMRFLISGGAALSSEVAHTITSFGVPVLEGFGLTETAGATHLNRLGGAEIGTVGLPLPLVQTRIADDGEVLLKGPGTMLGYLNDEAATKQAVDEAGWLRTGDLGEVTESGCLRITGRKKNIIVTASGKNVLPSKVERLLHDIPLVSHAIVYGEGKSYLVALLTVSASRLASWAAQRNILADDVTRLRSDVRLYADLQSALDEVNEKLPSHERVRRFAVLDSDFSLETGEITRDFKVRRAEVLRRHKDVIEMLYKERL